MRDPPQWGRLRRCRFADRNVSSLHAHGAGHIGGTAHFGGATISYRTKYFRLYEPEDQARPCVWAYAAAAVREGRPSFARTRVTWCWAVRWLMKRASPICWLDRPA